MQRALTLLIALCGAACTSDLGFGVALELSFGDQLDSTRLAATRRLVISATGDEQGEYPIDMSRSPERHERLFYRPNISTRTLALAVTAVDEIGAPIATGSTGPLGLARDHTTYAAVFLDLPGATDGGTDLDGGIIGPPGTFVIVGDYGRRVRSRDDGQTWTDDQVIAADGGLNVMNDLMDVTYGAGKFVAIHWRVMSSPTGVTWSDIPPETFDNNWISSLIYANGVFVGVGGFGSRVASTDGVSWTRTGIDTVLTLSRHAIAYGDGKGFVSINDDGHLSHTPDGLTWQFVSTPLGACEGKVAYGAGIYVVVCAGQVVTSPDGISWSTPKAITVSDPHLVFAQGHFTLVDTARVLTSTDGQTWTSHLAPGLTSGMLAFGHGTYVMASGTKVFRSVDGLNWTSVELGGAGLSGVAFGAWPN